MLRVSTGRRPNSRVLIGLQEGSDRELAAVTDTHRDIRDDQRAAT